MQIQAGASLVVGILLVGCARPTGAASPAEGQPPAAVAKNSGTPVAKIDGAAITEGELMAEAGPSIAAVERTYLQEVQNAKVRALDAIVERRLLEGQAKKEGISVDALLQREVASKVPEPAEAELRGIYDQTKASGRALPPFPDVKAEIAAFVRNERLQGARQEYVARLKAGAKVETMLPPLLLPKVEFKADGPARGDAGAPITIVEFSDYECPYCGRAQPALKRVMDEYKGKVRFVFQSFPLPIHPNAEKASEAALCAGEQGRYWELHERLFANQQALGVDQLKGYARSLGLEPGKFDSCLDSGRMAAVVAASRAAGEKAGVNATPTFFVNGRPLSGSQPFERFKEIIDHELKPSQR